MNKLAQEIAEWREGKGFETPCDLDSFENRNAMLGKLMMVVTEVAEAAEAVKHDDLFNFIEEIADTIIRLLDITGTMRIDIEQAIRDKMEVNKKRPQLHGKATTL